MNVCLFLLFFQFVVTMFWGLYTYDRELVYPKLLDNFIPPWLNHGMVGHFRVAYKYKFVISSVKLHCVQNIGEDFSKQTKMVRIHVIGNKRKICTYFYPIRSEITKNTVKNCVFNCTAHYWNNTDKFDYLLHKTCFSEVLSNLVLCTKSGLPNSIFRFLKRTRSLY